MRKTIIEIIVGVVVLAVVIAWVWAYKIDNDYACTMEAKLCPDGSYVGRIGPNCEFAACPGKNQTGGTLSEAQARVIAQNSCIKGGRSLESGYYNENTKTWWFDANLNTTQETQNHARGTVAFASGVPGGISLAAKIDGEWQIVPEFRIFYGSRLRQFYN